MEDLRNPVGNLMAAEDDREFFGILDDPINCGKNPSGATRPNLLISAWIDRVTFGPSVPGKGAGILTVVAHHGQRSMTPQEVEQCLDEQDPLAPNPGIDFFPAMKGYRIEFLFDGRTYKAAPGSLKAAQIFERR